MNGFQHSLPVLLASIFSLLLTACSSIEYDGNNSPRMLISEESTPFFHNGPAQGSGPDKFLGKGDEVAVFRKDMGYSLVLLQDGQKGYVANEALTPAPPSPVNQPTPVQDDVSISGSSLWNQPSFRY